MTEKETAQNNGASNDSAKCDFPRCGKNAVINFTTGDGVSHHYCSVEHANDHRNILIHELMKK